MKRFLSLLLVVGSLVSIGAAPAAAGYPHRYHNGYRAYPPGISAAYGYYPSGINYGVGYGGGYGTYVPRYSPYGYYPTVYGNPAASFASPAAFGFGPQAIFGY
ncbi:MAG: hypothetical protein K8U03_16950 [Planctomycetia bacterium]|nr:hypothetical protein [Planctomycetia bacterium]